MALRKAQFSAGKLFLYNYCLFTFDFTTQARKYFGHLATLRHDDPDVWLCLSVCCAMAEEFEECSTAIKRASTLIEKDDVRIKFCHGEIIIRCVFY